MIAKEAEGFLYIVSSLGVVSYTHLDVEKIKRAKFTGRQKVCRFLKKVFLFLIVFVVLAGVSIGTVSYTHLDVYKRQAEWRLR